MTKTRVTYIALLLVLTFGMYEGINAYFNGQPKGVKWHTVVKREKADFPVIRSDHLIPQRAMAESLWMVPSPDRNQYAFLSHGKQLKIMNAQNGHVTSQTVANEPVQSIKWISPRLLFFMTQNNVLYTFDVLTNQVRQIHGFPTGQTCESIAFSSFTNDVFVMFRNAGGNSVYQFNTNGNYFIRSLGNVSILNAYYGSTNTTLFFEHTSHSLYRFRYGFTAKLKERATIIKGAGNVLYYGNLNNRNQITAVNLYANSTSQLVSRLPKPADLNHVIVDHAGHVFEFDNHLLIDATKNKRWTIPSGSQLKKAGNTILLMKAGGYRVVVN